MPQTATTPPSGTPAAGEVEGDLAAGAEMTCAELARRYGISRSTVARALAKAPAQTALPLPEAGPEPPQPVNPGQPQLRYRVAEVDLWWPTRPGPGRRWPARPEPEPQAQAATVGQLQFEPAPQPAVEPEDLAQAAPPPPAAAPAVAARRVPARPVTGRKHGLGTDVLTAALRRIRRVFDDFANVCVSFSGGKDSGVLLELAANEARARGRTIGVLIVDLEAQYAATIDFIRAMLARHADVLEVYWVALPLNLRNAVSHIQPQWQCWDPDATDLWVRPQPDEAITDPAYFPFFHRGMEFEDFVPQFNQWYCQQHEGRMTASLVGIRSDESLNRFRTIASRRKTRHEGLAWTTWSGHGSVYNAYPIYDWQTRDIWIYNGRHHVPYNQIYDLMHRAGLSIHQARLCQPYGDDQKKGLWLFHVLEPRTWSKVVARVQGANFGARYARETGNILGRIKIEKPDGLTWQQYAEFLLNSMPTETAEMYRDRIAKHIHWYVMRGDHPSGQIPDDGPLNKTQPSWKRVVKVILTYDVYCKALTFAPPANAASYQAYKKKMRIKRQEWGYRGTV